MERIPQKELSQALRYPETLVGGLDDVLAKFRHACQFDPAALAVHAEWAASNPYQLMAGLEDDGRVIALYLLEREPPPVDVALLQADFIHNLRAALDILVCQLVEHHRHAVERDHCFPVVPLVENWKSAKGSNLKYLPGL